jgi:hypothetical protein
VWPSTLKGRGSYASSHVNWKIESAFIDMRARFSCILQSQSVSVRVLSSSFEVTLLGVLEEQTVQVLTGLCPVKRCCRPCAWYCLTQRTPQLLMVHMPLDLADNAELEKWTGMCPYENEIYIRSSIVLASRAADTMANVLQIFNGKDGNEKYPSRWIMLPPFF